MSGNPRPLRGRTMAQIKDGLDGRLAKITAIHFTEEGIELHQGEAIVATLPYPEGVVSLNGYQMGDRVEGRFIDGEWRPAHG
jgi:hypothetical protein